MNADASAFDRHLKPDEVRERLSELGTILEGHFKLSSGLHSNRYFQCAKVLQYPDLAKELGRLLAERCNELEIDLVLSPAVGGILIGHEVARALGRRHLFCERKEKQLQLRRDFTLRKGEAALLVDDVLTRGTALAEMRTVVERHEGTVKSIAVIVDRREETVALDLPVHSLLREEVRTYDPAQCPLCKKGIPLESPGSRHDA